MTTTRTWTDDLRAIGACEKARKWAEDYPSLQAAWDACENGSWMCWLIGKTIDCPPWSDGRKPLLACCLDIAETVKKLWPKEQAADIAGHIATLRAWIGDTATVEAAREAKSGLWGCHDAYYAYYAAAAAAAYAYYAAAAAADAAYTAAYVADAAYYAAYAYAAAWRTSKAKHLKQSAAIVRQHYPSPPRLTRKETPCTS